MRALLTTLAAGALLTLAGCGEPGDTAADQPSDPRPASTSASGERQAVPPSDTPTAPRDSATTEAGEPGTVGPDKPDKPGSPPSSVDPMAEMTRVPAKQVNAAGVPEYYDHRGAVWVSDDGTTLLLYAMANNGCAGAEAVIDEQSANTVRITLRSMKQPQGGAPDDVICTQALKAVQVLAHLDAPLADRTVHLSA